MKYLQAYPSLLPLVDYCPASDPVRFWLDGSTMLPQIIKAAQMEGEEVLVVMFKISRHYCHGLHKARLAHLKDY